MNLGVIPLLVVALMMVSADPEVETVQLILGGDHRIERHEGALILGDARVTVPAGTDIPGPVYVTGGEVTLGGTVSGDVIQLAGTLTVESTAVVGEELQHIAGTLLVADGARIGRQTSLDLAGERDDRWGVLPGMIVTLLMVGIALVLGRTRTDALDNVAGAIRRHSVVSATVGLLLTLTFVAVFVFMAMTLVLVPVALLGVLAGILTLGYGVVGFGHLLGNRLPLQERPSRTVAGVVLVMAGIQLSRFVPAVGDLIALAVLLTGLGAVVLTYFGVAPFRPASLPD